MMMMSTVKLEIITSNVITLFFRVKKKEDTNTEDSEKVGPQNWKKKDNPNKRDRYY